MNTTTMQFTDHDRFTAQQTLTNARQAASQLHRDLRNQLRDVEAFTDPHLTDEGLTARRDQMRAQVRERAATQARALRAQVDTATATLRRHAEAARPKVADDPASLMRHQQAWERAKMKLDAGMTLRDVLAQADLTETLALEEWAPTWMQANHPARDELGRRQAPDLTGFTRAVGQRLAELAPAQAATALNAHQAAQVDAAAITPMLNYADTIAKGGNPDPLQAALASRFAAQEAATGLPDDSDNTDGDDGGQAA